MRALGHEPVVAVVPLVHDPAAFDDVGVDCVFPTSKRSLAPILRGYEAHLGLCTGFNWLVPREAIDVPPLGIVNGHPTMLPKGRGPFPTAWAARSGETEIGLTYHFMDETFDTGNVLAQKAIPFSPDDTNETLNPQFEAAARELLPQVFAKLAAGDPGTPQGEGEHQLPFETEYAVLDTTRTAAEAHRQVRAWSFMPPRRRLGPTLDGVRIVRSSLTEVEGAQRVECADGPLWIVETAPV